VLIILLSLAGIILFIAVVFTMDTIRKQQHKELDKGMNALTVKHPVLANPITIAFVLFVIICLLVAFFSYLYYNQ
jgi:amino acid transporter